MVDSSSNLLKTTLNVNGLNTPIKGQGLAEWTKKHDSMICCLQETNFKYDIGRLKVKKWKKYIM